MPAEPTTTDRPLASADAVRREDAFWSRRWRRAHVGRPGLDYEDWAPAYCVGTIGQAQYGGSFEDAQASLWANWARIRGDSRLTHEEARAAMREAWDRQARRALRR